MRPESTRFLVSILINLYTVTVPNREKLLKNARFDFLSLNIKSRKNEVSLPLPVKVSEVNSLRLIFCARDRTIRTEQSVLQK